MSGPMHIREIIYAGQDLCITNRHPQAKWRKQATTSGVQYGYRCPTCDRWVTVECWGDRGARGIWVSADFVAGLGVSLDEVPAMLREASWRRCQHCRKAARCEDHHWAPQAIFPDADQWPIGPLCMDCHLTYTKTLESYIQRRIDKVMARRRRIS